MSIKYSNNQEIIGLLYALQKRKDMYGVARQLEVDNLYSYWIDVSGENYKISDKEWRFKKMICEQK